MNVETTPKSEIESPKTSFDKAYEAVPTTEVVSNIVDHASIWFKGNHIDAMQADIARLEHTKPEETSSDTAKELEMKKNILEQYAEDRENARNSIARVFEQKIADNDGAIASLDIAIGEVEKNRDIGKTSADFLRKAQAFLTEQIQQNTELLSEDRAIYMAISEEVALKITALDAVVATHGVHAVQYTSEKSLRMEESATWKSRIVKKTMDESKQQPV